MLQNRIMRQEKGESENLGFSVPKILIFSVCGSFIAFVRW